MPTWKKSDIADANINIGTASSYGQNDFTTIEHDESGFCLEELLHPVYQILCGSHYCYETHTANGCDSIHWIHDTAASCTSVKATKRPFPVNGWIFSLQYTLIKFRQYNYAGNDRALTQWPRMAPLVHDMWHLIERFGLGGLKLVELTIHAITFEHTCMCIDWSY